MASTSGPAIWIRLLLRSALLVLAAVALSLARGRYIAFSISTAIAFRFDTAMWLTYGALMVLGGLLFGLAVWMPLTRFRYLPSRLIIAAVAMVPFFNTLWLDTHAADSGLTQFWLTRPRWFSDPPIVGACAALAGVAIASGLRSAEEGGSAGPSTPGSASSR